MRCGLHRWSPWARPLARPSARSEAEVLREYPRGAEPSVQQSRVVLNDLCRLDGLETPDVIQLGGFDVTLFHRVFPCLVAVWFLPSCHFLFGVLIRRRHSLALFSSPCASDL